MTKHPITIKDLAKILGISVSTVSRALKDHPDISVRTKKAVQDLAKELQYQPNEIALSLKNRKSKIIGIIVPKLVHHFFSSVIDGVENIAYANGYQVMIYNSDENYEREILLTQSILSFRLDGLIISMSKETTDFSHFEKLEHYGVPVVYFDRVPDIDCNKVIFDDFQGAYDAVNHLIKHGCKTIAHLRASEHMGIGRNRLAGYKAALVENGIEYNPNLVVKCDTFDEAVPITSELLAKFKNLDGLFAVNDLTGIGASKAINMAGKRVPEDIKVIGFTNEISSAVCAPSLSTVDQQGTKMGEVAASLLLDTINKDQPHQTKVVKAELII
ncbi:MAG: LacI family DNA-binding transcriptional regulator, partial [Bacteroidales bacterium]|nr:LacI family DNA-binding transcriptional regulator [Bacteroidales bacterium]